MLAFPWASQYCIFRYICRAFNVATLIQYVNWLLIPWHHLEIPTWKYRLPTSPESPWFLKIKSGSQAACHSSGSCAILEHAVLVFFRQHRCSMVEVYGAVSRPISRTTKWSVLEPDKFFLEVIVYTRASTLCEEKITDLNSCEVKAVVDFYLVFHSFSIPPHVAAIRKHTMCFIRKILNESHQVAHAFFHVIFSLKSCHLGRHESWMNCKRVYVGGDIFQINRHCSC